MNFFKIDFFSKMYKNPEIRQNPWTGEEANKLLEILSSDHFTKDWDEILSIFKKRTKEDILLHLFQLPLINTKINKIYQDEKIEKNEENCFEENFNLDKIHIYGVKF